LGARSALLARAGSQALYRGVLPGADLSYQVTSGSVKESVVLAAAPSAPVSYRWQLSGTGFSVRAGRDGEIELVADADGSVAMTIPPAVMVDSSGKAQVSEPATANAPMTVTKDASGWLLTITPDLSWLQAPERVYPVKIDPTVYATGQSNVYSYKSDGTVLHDGYARIGNARDNGDKYWRSVFTYNYAQFFGTQVLDAQVQASVATGTVNNYYAQTGWANAFSYSGEGTTDATTYISSSGTFSGSTISQQYANWVASGVSGTYVYMAGYELAGLYTYKQVTSNLVITTSQFPTAAVSSPGNGATVGITPTLTGSFADPAGSPWMQVLFRVGTTSNPDASAVYDSGWVSPSSGSSSIQVSAGHLNEGTTYYWKVWVRNAYDGTYGVSTQRASGVWSFTTNTVSKVSQSSLTFDGVSMPGSGTATIVTTSPTIAWAAAPSDPNGPLQYQVQVATGSDAVTGTVVSSGWQSGTSFAVPEGSLTDGGVYSYTVLTQDALSQGAQPWTGHFQVNRRLAESGPSPIEQVGPVSVNLANGNAGLRFASPTVATVGGPMGLSFSYNSKVSRTKGLLGRYYAAGSTPSSYTFNTAPLTTRIDPQLNFSWGNGSPSPAVPVDQFAARWSGFITVPTSGVWTFGVLQDDGARVKVGTTTVLDRWSDQFGQNWATTTSTLDSSTPTAIQVDYYENTGGATFQLLVKGPGFPDGIVVPSDWLSPTFETLPAGWSASSALAGESATYVSASIDVGAVVVTDQTGTTHTYTKTSAGGYTPPPGEYGVLTLSPAGLVNLTDESGTVYAFGANGRLESATPPADAKNPATPSQTWRAGTGQLDAVTDRASGKAIHFYYANDTSGPEGTGVAPCSAAAGFGPTPPGDVCRIAYPSSTGTGVGPSTYLYYDTSGRLQRIVDPGSEVTDFQYAATGELTGIRTPLVMDWLAADTSRAAADANLVQIAYSGSTPATRKVTSVTLPAADGVTTTGRLTTSFTYTTTAGGGTTYVDRTGIAPSGHARTVTFDPTLRQLTDTTATGQTSSQVWDPAKDLLDSATDGAGRMTTTIYDARDRPIETYGPAPATCFGSDRRPLSTCPITPAHSTTGYDQNLHGLNVAYFNNGGFAGQPAGFALGLGSGGLSGSWAAGVYPDGSITQNLWSARATGVIKFPSGGTYTFTASNVDDAVSVWVDDTLLLSASIGTSVSMPITRTAAGPARIRVEYANAGGGLGSFTLAWSGPSVTSGTIPDSALEPDYGLSTSTSSVDSAPASVPAGTPAVTSAQVPSLTTSTGYGTRPWLGQPTTASLDPTGLNLTTTTVYETASSGYNRRIGKWLPSATAAGLTDTTHGYSYAYYAAGDTQPAVCSAPAGAFPAGLVKTVTEPTPATGAPVVTSYVYDEWGRVLGTNKAGDTGWTCTAYDARGRITRVDVAGANGAPARTVTTNYAVGNNPLVSSVSDPAGTITTTIDLLGRTVTYTDVKGTMTATSYDVAGRPAQQVTTPAAGGPSSTVATTYLDDGRVASVSVDGTVVSQPSYDTNAELSGVTYPTMTAAAPLATPAFVQQTSTHQLNKTSVTLTPTTALTAGNRLIVQVGVWGNSPATAASVTDSTGETFTKVLDVTASDGTQLSLWTAVVAGGGGAKPTITVTPSRTADVGVVAAEYSGLSTNGTGVDQTASATGTTTTAGTISSGSAGPVAGANELAVGLYADSGFGSTLTAGSGWTQRANISGASDLDLLLQDQTLTAGASVASTTGTGASTPWDAGVVLFQPAGAPTITTTTATPAFVQQTSTHQLNKTSVQVTPTAALGTGNRLIVQIGIWGNPNATAASVSDAAGDVFTQVTSFVGSDSTQLSVWTAPVTAGAGQTPVITVTPSRTADVGVVAAEYSGLSTTGTAVDTTAHATGTTSTAATVSSGSRPPPRGTTSWPSACTPTPGSATP
jgi:YD repeat-containing protein